LQDIEAWLSRFVNSPDFSKALESEITLLDKPSERLRVRMELLSYVVPKVKGIDPTPDNADKDVSVTYVKDDAK
jgi:hypothetical protein